MLCPCGTGSAYAMCCQPLHEGQQETRCEQIVRARYSAYALNLPEYIIETTHPASPYFSDETQEWKNSLSEVCQQLQLEKLQILDCKEEECYAVITFVTHRKENEEIVISTERSYFEKWLGRWFYRQGQLFSGHDESAIIKGPLKLLPLAYYGHPILRKVAEPITYITEDLRQLVEEMIVNMDAYDGVGLAAPQIQRSLQIFVMRIPVKKEDGSIVITDVKTFINPKLSNPSVETWSVAEGCLSIPALREEVERPEEIDVEYMDLEGKQHKERFSGWFARIIMHEYDHLQGVLFIDYLEGEKKDNIQVHLQNLSHRIYGDSETINKQEYSL